MRISDWSSEVCSSDLALISNTQGLPDYPDQALIAPAMHVADYAVTALYYHKLPVEYGTTPAAARAEAERWARETYLPALRRIATMPVAEREAQRRELARRIANGSASRRYRTGSDVEYSAVPPP